MTLVPMAATPVEADPDPAVADMLLAARLQGSTPLRALRRERQLTTIDLARRSGISHDEIIALENGADFSAVQLYALSAALDVPSSTLAT